MFPRLWTPLKLCFTPWLPCAVFEILLRCALNRDVGRHLEWYTGIVSAHSYFTDVLNRDFCEAFSSNNVAKIIFIASSARASQFVDETNSRTFSRIPFGKEDKRIVRNAGKPQINVHFYVMAAMNTGKCRRNKSGKTGILTFFLCKKKKLHRKNLWMWSLDLLVVIYYLAYFLDHKPQFVRGKVLWMQI